MMVKVEVTRWIRPTACSDNTVFPSSWHLLHDILMLANIGYYCIECGTTHCEYNKLDTKEVPFLAYDSCWKLSIQFHENILHSLITMFLLSINMIESVSATPNNRYKFALVVYDHYAWILDFYLHLLHMMNIETWASGNQTCSMLSVCLTKR